MVSQHHFKGIYSVKIWRILVLFTRHVKWKRWGALTPPTPSPFDKPGSVSNRSWRTVIHLAPQLLAGSCDLPKDHLFRLCGSHRTQASIFCLVFLCVEITAFHPLLFPAGTRLCGSSTHLTTNGSVITEILSEKSEGGRYPLRYPKKPGLSSRPKASDRLKELKGV